MAKTLDALDDKLLAFLAEQHLFFVATAPSGDAGHVNLSPKGYDTFRVLGPREVAYLDLTGSGVETLAHLRQNGRITLMFCAFEGPPRILRLYGQGRAVLPDDADFAKLAERFPSLPGRRAIVVVNVERIQSSCGYAVPFMAYEREREQLVEWADKKGDDGLAKYQGEKNARSIDGLPGLPVGEGD